MLKEKFENIAGYEKEKEELSQLAYVLKNNKQLNEMGGRMPKGLLLIGDNGVGKSVMARAFINESCLNCLRVDSSKREGDFDQHINGVFKEAVKCKPCIILIEEIDKIAARNDMFSYGGCNYDRYNALLTCINEIAGEDEVFILATANQRMKLDYSLIRSGRIDSIIHIDLPTEKDREEIFKIYSVGKQIDGKIDFKFLAKATNYFSGADIEAVMNEAVILACKQGKNTIKRKDIETAINNKKFSNYEKESEMDEEHQRVVATHEAGHAVMMLFGPHRNITRVSILPRGGIRGYAEMQGEERVQSVLEKKNLVNVALGGMAAEKIFYDVAFNGSGSDMAKAQSIIHSLICEDGIKGYDLLVNDLSLRNSFQDEVKISQKKLEAIEIAEAETFKEIMEETTSLLYKHKHLVEHIVHELTTKKMLEKEELETIYNKYLNSLEKKEKIAIINDSKNKYSIKWNGHYTVNGAIAN